MEKCKFCEAELEENSTVCPKCGKDNATEKVQQENAPAENVEAPAEVAENAEPAAPIAEEAVEAKKLPVGKIALAVVAVIAIVAVLVAVLSGGMKKEESAVDGENLPEEVVEATVPADGNPDDETCKGTYTASDDAVLAARDTVIATAGDKELTLGQLQVYYWMEVRNFLGNYGAYAAYFGLDYTQPLDQQVCGVSETPMSWQQFFLKSALNSWQTYQGMAAEAEAQNVPMEEEFETMLANMRSDLEASAAENGFENADDVLHKSLGNAATMEDYEHFMRLYYEGFSYFNTVQDGFQPTDEEVEAYFAEHELDYADNDISKDDKYVDVRHILIIPENQDEAGEYTEEAWAAAEAKSQEILDAWLAGEQTEDSFAALANEHSQDPGSNTNGGLYTKVAQGDMVEAFDAWCFDDSREVGHFGIVKTNYGYHIMYYVGSSYVWKEYAANDLIEERSTAFMNSVIEKYPLSVKYGEILLSSVDMAQ